MTDSLARSLVDAAAEAICESVKLDLQMPHGDARTWSADTWKGEGRATVAAVLETLAANRSIMSDEFLRRLAEETRTEK